MLRNLSNNTVLCYLWIVVNSVVESIEPFSNKLINKAQVTVYNFL